MRYFIHFFSLFMALILGSLTTQARTFSDWVQVVYSQSTGREVSRLEKEKAEAIKDGADSFTTTTVLVAPYLQKYKLSDVTQAYDGQQKGYRLGLEQNTTYGFGFQVGYDKKTENNLSTSLNDKSGLSWAVSVRLLENFAGRADRLTTNSLLADAQVSEIQAEISLRQSCEAVIQNVATVWSLQEKSRFLEEIQQDAKVLNQVLSKSHQSGQLSRIEYLGAQSELLNIENQKLQTDRELASALYQLFAESKEKNISMSLGSDPSTYFEKIWDEYKKMGPSERLSTLLQQQQVQSYEMRAESLKNKNLPELDLVLTQVQREGDLLGQNYKEDDQKAELKFSWKLNDQAEKSLLKQTEALKLQARLNQDKIQRQQSMDYEKTSQDLSRQLKTIENLNRRLKYLFDIKNEYLRRYRQGRVDFQEYLRQKEIWSQTSFQLIDSKVTTWNDLTKAYHQLVRLENICEKRGSL